MSVFLDKFATVISIDHAEANSSEQEVVESKRGALQEYWRAFPYLKYTVTSIYTSQLQQKYFRYFLDICLEERMLRYVTEVLQRR